MPALLGRIKRLESRVQVLAGPCTVCGRWPSRRDELQPHALRYSFEPGEPAWCPLCGKQTVYVFTFESPKDTPA